ncbi:hypothetical protein ACKVWC_008546 [Pyricularia oryzae]|nr:hypothetical protein MCOR01_008057 [Pyricularia oryzae]KAI6326822.1 hypothetical protein MCOR30_006436 [Pyricularia oryzae]KAI6342395.1 hypothetical protein MCOR28_005474 [Pyricularia oryzae]KAI6406680.1 hypothetical protein MCOR23_002096 [Pyricularia oryzae]KAI6414742.1 hypothetical protein MCOR24_006273 [Pyricularia oryzae]
MSAPSDPSNTRGSQLQGKRHTKVKSGCRTCKVRRVKCDEGRPACQRCVSTRRVCEGYGIWGGGSQVYSPAVAAAAAASANANAVTLSQAGEVRRQTVTESEYRYLDWFKERAKRKLMGPFDWNFWDNLLMQATASEPAVLHAALAISTAHQARFTAAAAALGNANHIPSMDTPDGLEQFTLEQYNKSIRHLNRQPVSGSGSKPAVRVTIITCAVFVCLENLRGNYRTAFKHLQNGLRLLNQMQPSRPAGPRRKNSMTLEVGPKQHREVIDDWLVDTFARLNLQATMLGGTSNPHQVVPRTLSPQLPTHSYESVAHARLHIDRLVNNIICLQAERDGQGETTAKQLAEQKLILAELEIWHRAFVTYEKDHIGVYDIKERIAATILHSFHAMGVVMVTTCLGPQSEMSYDALLKHFITIINDSREMVNVCFTYIPKYAHGVSHVDIGWIAPLYYTAIRCRIRRIRHQAIKLMRVAGHSEGFWDARIAAGIASDIIKVEEGNFFANPQEDQDLKQVAAVDPLPSEQDLLDLPVLPENRRLRNVKISLPDSLDEKLRASWESKLQDGEWKHINKEYNLAEINDHYQFVKSD